MKVEYAKHKNNNSRLSAIVKLKLELGQVLMQSNNFERGVGP